MTTDLPGLILTRRDLTLLFVEAVASGEFNHAAEFADVLLIENDEVEDA